MALIQYLYNNGTRTVPWERNNYVYYTGDNYYSGADATISFDTNNVLVQANYGGNLTKGAKIVTSNSFDITNVSKVYIDVYSVSSTSNIKGAAVITTKNTYSGSATSPNAKRTEYKSTAGLKEIDVSTLTGNYFMSLYSMANVTGSTTAQRVSEVYLEYLYDVNVSYDTTKGNVTKTNYFDSVTLEANAILGYRFDGWTIDGVDNTANPITILADSNKNVVANFSAIANITLNYDETLGYAEYNWLDNSTIQLTATPNSNAQFKGRYINSTFISNDLIYDYTISNDVIIEARFDEVYSISDSVSGNGGIQFTRGVDQNDVVFSVIAGTNNHFVKYEINGVEYETTPLSLHLTENITIIAYFEEDDRYIVSTKTNFEYGSVFVSDNNVFAGTEVTIWARPFADYNFVRWEDGNYENPRTITVNSNVTMVAIYQRTFETNGIYQYRCYVKDQLDLEAPPKAFMVVDTFDISTDLLTNATSSITVMKMLSDIDEGDVLVLYDPMGTTLYTGVINSIGDRTINCSQMQSFYKGTWIYNVSPQDYLEHEIAVLLQDYADGKLYRSSYVDPLVAQRLGGITIDYVGTTTVNLPTDLDDDGNEQMTTYDMEEWIYELYQKYSIKFEFEINISGTNYVHIRVPSYETIKVGNNMFAIQDMSPITEIEETNKLVIYAQNKTYRTTYIATKNSIVEAPNTTANRFNITNTEVVFSDDPVEDLVASSLPESMFNHKLTFTLIIKNFLYTFGDFNLGGELDVYYNDDYYRSVLTGYEISKQSNQNITEVKMIAGKVRIALTKMLTMKSI